MNAAILGGEEAISAQPAVFGGIKIGQTGFTVLEEDSVARCEIIKNNATNYTNSFLRMDLKPKEGYTFIIEKIIVKQKSSITNRSNYFRIGATLNAQNPNQNDLEQSSDNVAFSSSFIPRSFIPGETVRSITGNNHASAWLCARGSSTDTFDWFIDEVEIQGTYFLGNPLLNITVSNNIKQLLRFGIDAERLWYWRTGSTRTRIAELGVKELKADYVRVAVNCAYEKEEGDKQLLEYSQIWNMMYAMKAANADIKFFASPRPLDEAYDKNESVAVWGHKDNVPWAPYPRWILEWNQNGTKKMDDGTVVPKWVQGAFHVDKLIQYYADYLNLMNTKGFVISYLDLTNEKNVITPSISKYIYHNLPSKLNAGVEMPELIVPSAWSLGQGTDWLKSVDQTKNEHLSFSIASAHNTGKDGSPEEFSAAARKLDKEVWNTELHEWIGIDIRDEILNSSSFWEHMRGGFTGIDTWLFYGPLNGKDHTMIWSSDNSVVKSGKYEMFKKVVNTVNLGNYLEVSMPNNDLMTAAFVKDSVVLLTVLNRGKAKIKGVNIQFEQRNLKGKTVEVNEWHAKYLKSGKSSSFICENTNGFTYDMDTTSLYYFTIDFTQKPNKTKTAIKSDVQIFPNPAKSHLKINSNETDMPLNYVIYDVYGKSLALGTCNNNTIKIDQLTSGSYILQLENSNVNQRLLFVKE